MNSLSNVNKGRLKKLSQALISRRALQVYLIGIGIAAGALFGEFVDTEPWISIVLAVLVSFFFLQAEQVYYLSKTIGDIHPGSSPTRQIIEKHSQMFKDFTQDALSVTEKRLLTTVKALPGLSTLAAHPTIQQYLLRIGETLRSTSEQATSVMNRIVALSLEETASDVEHVARSKLVIRKEPEIADPRWKALLEPASIGQCAVATSWVLPEWWNLNKVWRGENEAAMEKGLRLARIFIVEDEEELEANKLVMREQAKQGIQVNWVYANCLRENDIDPRDILVSNCVIADFDNPDNSNKQLVNGSIYGEQVLETVEPDGSKKTGYRLLARSVEISAYPDLVSNTCTIIERIYQLSERFDDADWWSYFFDDDYSPITRYKEKSAERETGMLIKATNLKAGMRILDLGCAYGRIEHILEKKRLGSIEVIPVECSTKLLNEATSSVIHAFTQGGIATLDMRDIDKFYNEKFDVVMSIFTSWGYFRENDNQRMFEKVFVVLKPGGFFYLDVDNPLFIRANDELAEYESDGHTIRRWDSIKASKEKDRNGELVTVDRRLSQFSVVYPNGSIKSKPLVSLRLYELNELKAIASGAGFEFLHAYNEQGKEWRAGRSLRAEHMPERMIVILRKPPR